MPCDPHPEDPLSRFYANLTTQGPGQADVVAYLNAAGRVAYVSPTLKGCTVIYHEDLSAQEELAAALSRHFRCPALLMMAYNDTILLYHLYVERRANRRLRLQPPRRTRPRRVRRVRRVGK